MAQAKVASVEWTVDPKRLGEAIERQYARRLVGRVRSVVRDAAPEAEAHMKQYAPWRDQTGQARKLLMADWKDDGKAVTLYLIHGAAYGIWLELRHAGRYAIIAPTVHEFAGRMRLRIGRGD